MTWADDIGNTKVQQNGTSVGTTRTINVTGSGVSASTDSSGVVTLAISGGGGTVTAVADLPTLRLTSPVNNQAFIVASPPGNWVYLTGDGANVPDDGESTVKLTATPLSSNGRFYNTGSTSPATIAALRLQASGKQKRTRVLCYSTLGDGGGGEFIWDATSIAADNGGTIIAPTGVATGRWIRHIGGHRIAVRMFGAKGDYEQYTTGQDATASSALVPWRAWAATDGAGYVGKTIQIKGAGVAGADYSGTITAYDAITHNWTVSPTPSTTVTNQPNIYATDDTAAFQLAKDYVNTLTNTAIATGTDLRSAKLSLPRGTFYVPRSLTGSPCGMEGDNATIVGNAGVSNLFDVVPPSELSGYFQFHGIVFRQLHSVVRAWTSTIATVPSAYVDFIGCKFQNVDSAVLNSRVANLFVNYVACSTFNSILFKGLNGGIAITGLTGESRYGNDGTNFTVATPGNYTAGLVEFGGTDAGVTCPATSAGAGSIATFRGVSLSPALTVAATTAQAWIVASIISNIDIDACRFGGESGGLPLVLLQAGADGSQIAVSGQTSAPSPIEPFTFNGAAPERIYVAPGSEIGNYGGAGKPLISITQTDYDKLAKRTTNWLQVSKAAVGATGNVNGASMVDTPVSCGPSTPLLNLSRMFNARERTGGPTQNYDTSGAAFDGVSGTNVNSTAGSIWGLATVIAFSNDGINPMSSTWTKYFPESLTAGWYTAIVPYRSKGLGTFTSQMLAYSTAGAIPGYIALEDTDGEIATASYSFYHDGSATLHTHTLTFILRTPAGTSTTNYVELGKASLVKGKYGADYIPVGGTGRDAFRYKFSKTWDPASVAAGSQTSTTITSTGAKLGDKVEVTFSLDQQLLDLRGYVSAADVVTVLLMNHTAGAVDLGSGTLTAYVTRPS